MLSKIFNKKNIFIITLATSFLGSFFIGYFYKEFKDSFSKIKGAFPSLIKNIAKDDKATLSNYNSNNKAYLDKKNASLNKNPRNSNIANSSRNNTSRGGYKNSTNAYSNETIFSDDYSNSSLSDNSLNEDYDLDVDFDDLQDSFNEIIDNEIIDNDKNDKKNLKKQKNKHNLLRTNQNNEENIRNTGNLIRKEIQKQYLKMEKDHAQRRMVEKLNDKTKEILKSLLV